MFGPLPEGGREDGAPLSPPLWTSLFRATFLSWEFLPEFPGSTSIFLALCPNSHYRSTGGSCIGQVFPTVAIAYPHHSPIWTPSDSVICGHRVRKPGFPAEQNSADLCCILWAREREGITITGIPRELAQLVCWGCFCSSWVLNSMLFLPRSSRLRIEPHVLNHLSASGSLRCFYCMLFVSRKRQFWIIAPQVTSKKVLKDVNCQLSRYPKAMKDAFQFGGSSVSHLEFSDIPATFQERWQGVFFFFPFPLLLGEVSIIKRE